MMPQSPIKNPTKPFAALHNVPLNPSAPKMESRNASGGARPTVVRSTLPAKPSGVFTPRLRRYAMTDRLNAVIQVERGQKTPTAISVEYGINIRTYYRWAAQVTHMWRRRQDAGSDGAEEIDLADLTGLNTRRIVVSDGKNKVPIVWYSGTEAEDIREVVRKRFKLGVGTPFLLRDCFGNGVDISARVASGEYDLVVV